MENQNEILAKVFDQMAREKAKENDRYRKRAYENAASAIRRHPKIITSGKQAQGEIVGVGKRIADKIDEILTTGKLQVLERRTPEEVLETKTIELFEKIHGVGIKKAQEWYNKGYRTIDDLKAEYDNMTDAQKLGYYYFDDLQKRIPREETQKVENYLRSIWKQEFIIGGSYRRGEPDSSDIDVIVKDGVTMTQLLKPLMQDKFIIGNLAIGNKHYMGIVRLNKEYPVRRLDIQLVSEQEWPFTAIFFTGDLRMNIELRKRATSLGYKLGNYDLIDNQGNSLKAKTEKDVFDLLKVVYLEPTERKGAFVLQFFEDIKPVIKRQVKEEIPVQLKQEVHGKWYRPTEDLFVYYGEGIINNGKVAAFDLDGTIIRPSKGDFPKDPNDIVIMPNRLETLKKYLDLGYLLVIFTNQRSKTDKQKRANYARVTNSIKMINLPLMLFMSTGDDEFRKPNTGMWDALKGMDSIREAFFTGDAANRPGDHSDTDLRFAENIGIQFFTPEEIFGI